MSGPYPPPGPQYPQERGWWGGQQGPNPYPGPPQPGPQPGLLPPGPQPQPGQFDVGHDFPTVRYSGLGGQQGGWGEQQQPPPPKRRGIGRVIVATVCILVIVGGVVTGIVLLNERQSPPQAASQTSQNVAPPVVTSQQQGTTAPTTDTNDPGVPNGSSSLTLTAGACVTAQVTAQQYTAVHQVTCGTAQSDLILAMTSPDMAGCADRQYLRLSAPNAGVYCFTLDVKQGDCVDNNYLKTPCSTAPYVVLSTEAGPGSANSCTGATGATHWVPVGRDPVKVGCLAPTKSS